MRTCSRPRSAVYTPQDGLGFDMPYTNASVKIPPEGSRPETGGLVSRLPPSNVPSSFSLWAGLLT